MNLFRQFNRLRFGFTGLFVVMLLTACGGIENPSSFTESASAPPAKPDIAYGTSIDELEETTQEEPSSTRSEEEVTEGAFTIGIPVTIDDIVYQEIMWDGLVPPDFTVDAIMSRYEDELASIMDGSPEANELYMTMQEEFNNAPVNEILDDTMIRIPGFITPLEYEDDLITEFLLVPYFGACIHVPAPPANQTVLVQAAEGHGIQATDAYRPIWVMGRLSTQGTTTELAQAGYYVQDGTFELYTNSN